MITAIREVRRAKGMTLDQVARACVPPTSPQMVSRLETGNRTVSVAWLNRLADALGVAAADLVTLPARGDLPVAALLDADGARAPRRAAALVSPSPIAGTLAIQVAGSIGDYRAGDEIWAERLAPADFTRALNRDVLVPRPAGRFLFGRLLGRDAGTGDAVGKLHLQPAGPGARQQVVTDPPWLALATRLIRTL